jgi:hypothetical protein
MAEARSLEAAAPGNVRPLSWEDLGAAGRAARLEDIDERQIAQARLNAYGPQPLSDIEWIWGSLSGDFH